MTRTAASHSTTGTPTNAATTHIHIAFRPLPPGFINAVALDNVSLAAVPEPGSLSLIAVAALGWLRRRQA